MVALSFNHAHHLDYRAVRRQHSGSHTSSGRILLNDMLIAARRDCIDYVIIHRLCHVVEPNHSPRFFRLLNRLMPDWERRKELLERSMI